jgi:hypothetical protein
MSDYGQRHRPPASPGADRSAQQGEAPRIAGGSVEADREWARARIARALARENEHRVMRKAEAGTAPALRVGAAQPIAGWRERLEPAPHPYKIPIDHEAAAGGYAAKQAGAPVMLKKKEAAAPAKAPPPSKNDPARIDAQRAQQREHELEPKEPKPQALPHKPLSEKGEKEIKAKIAARTATKEEAERFDWHTRFKKFRARGVSRMWAEEAAELDAGKPGTRNWTPEQKAAILAGETPKAPDGSSMIGHHKYGVATYPQMAGDPKNVTPVTKMEHQERWHAGNTQTPVHGEPRNPSRAAEF